MATTARLTLDPAFRIGPVEPRLFGSFVEHMGRCVYTGVFEPGHPLADADGLRTDVLELTRELGVTLVRYPGGNFVSKLPLGGRRRPGEERPARLDLAWRSLEGNGFGSTSSWLGRQGGVEPMMGAQPRHQGGGRGAGAGRVHQTTPAARACRTCARSHGVDKPHDVRLWWPGQ
ncbi:hypothetical protein [Streptosporangium vulgare]|uniref:hypothetical protein n=1 Tax=Streptosporangium vulgare TaxID=46190 RepID=UPI0031D413BE